jgi:glycosyltransferase involved in cell wall biosynthesis
MTAVTRMAFIGNSLPRRCGIATFTTDLQRAVATSRPDLESCIVAMTDQGKHYDYPDSVAFEIQDQNLAEYLQAADFLNAGRYEIVCLQHEFGIFGGEAGGHILTLLARLNMPIVTTLHTVLAKPTPAQRSVLDQIIALSQKIVVMAKKGYELLVTEYAVPAGKIEIIPHGIPDYPFIEPDLAKEKLGFTGKSVILTFGLLSPNKGIEVMIDALPEILESKATAVYVVLGATHPNLVRDQGEAYRTSLVARADVLNVADHIVFLDQFVDQATLLDFISMCDIYVTPYLNEAQMTSGTLAYSFGLGRAVVSTPYWHACELLADGRGILVPFGDANAIGREIAGLLADKPRRQAMRNRAYASSRSMTWEKVAERTMDIVKAVRSARQFWVVKTPARNDLDHSQLPPPEIRLGYFLSMCDDTGMLQHAVHSVPDRSHGYCVDDNARALLLACALNRPGEVRLTEVLTSRLAAFVQHAWNPDTARFRNFMSFSRNWLEETGSEDSHGRTLWALGECARSDANLSRRAWAVSLFAASLATTEKFASPRAWAFTLLGLDAYCSVAIDNPIALRLRYVLAERLMAIFSAVETADWTWFEEGLAYDNARLAQALLVTGISAQTPRYIEVGMRSLKWLMALQISPAGAYRPIGTDSFGERRMSPQPFDQQPVEAAACISACLAAWRTDGDNDWIFQATRVFAWFLGDNDLSTPLVDIDTGSCRDGLHQDRPNENRGAESVLSYLLGLCELRQIRRIASLRPEFVARLSEKREYSAKTISTN